MTLFGDHQVIKKRITFAGILLVVISCLVIVYHQTKPTPPPIASSVVVWVHALSFTPAGDRLAFSFCSQNFNGIFVADLTGKVLEQVGLEEPGVTYRDPVVSSDGDHIAFGFGLKNTPQNLYQVSLSDHAVTRFTSSPYYDLPFAYSRDGSTIFFVRHRQFVRASMAGFIHGDLYRFSLATGLIQQLTRADLSMLNHIQLFPDERKALISTTSRKRLGSTLLLVDLQRPEEVTPFLVNLQAFAPEPRAEAWDLDKARLYESLPGQPSPPGSTYRYLDISFFALSPDGKYLVFSWNNPATPYATFGEGHQLYVTELASQQTRKLTALPTEAWPKAFAPDSRTIYFATDSRPLDNGQTYFPETGLWRIKVDGTGLAPVSLDFSGVVGKQPWITDNQALLAMKAVSQP